METVYTFDANTMTLFNNYWQGMSIEEITSKYGRVGQGSLDQYRLWLGLNDQQRQIIIDTYYTTYESVYVTVRISTH